MMNTDLVAYYKNRAKEYEHIYSKPERQHDLERAAEQLQQLFRNKNVFEIGCGTGYWTECIAQTAASVFATDINESVLDIARNKNYGTIQPVFAIADFNKYTPAIKYDALFGGFIWSHIPLQNIIKFIEQVNSFVAPGGTVVLMDNNYVPGSNHPITQTDAHGNTFQTRKLEDGTTHLVMKNFPSGTFLEKQLDGLANDIRIINLEYFWILAYTPLHQ